MTSNRALLCCVQSEKAATSFRVCSASILLSGWASRAALAASRQFQFCGFIIETVTRAEHILRLASALPGPALTDQSFALAQGLIVRAPPSQGPCCSARGAA